MKQPDPHSGPRSDRPFHSGISSGLRCPPAPGVCLVLLTAEGQASEARELRSSHSGFGGQLRSGVIPQDFSGLRERKNRVRDSGRAGESPHAVFPELTLLLRPRGPSLFTPKASSFSLLSVLLRDLTLESSGSDRAGGFLSFGSPQRLRGPAKLSFSDRYVSPTAAKPSGKTISLSGPREGEEGTART